MKVKIWSAVCATTQGNSGSDCLKPVLRLSSFCGRKSLSIQQHQTSVKETLSSFSIAMLWFLLKTLCTEACEAQLCRVNMTRMVKNSWSESMKNKHEVKINTRISTRLSAHTCEMASEIIWSYIRATKRGKHSLKKTKKKWFHKYFKRGRQYHPIIKSFLLSCFVFA